MSGCGLMFCIGIPFTNITLMAPFIILGVGLDDTFIITGAYFRRLKEEIDQDHEEKGSARSLAASKADALDESSSSDEKSAGATNPPGPTASGSNPIAQLYDHNIVVERVRSTMEEVGMSISLTTLTTTTAFILGCISSIPGIRWLCLCKYSTKLGAAFFLHTERNSNRFVHSCHHSCYAQTDSSATIVFDFFYQITYFVAL